MSLNKYIPSVVIYSVWAIICIFVFGYFLDFFNSAYFRFGPSDDLFIIGLNISVSSWKNYSFLMLYAFFSPLIVVYVWDTIGPWINSDILNREKEVIASNKKHTWLMINYFYLINEICGIFSIGLSMTQVDFFLIGAAAVMVSGGFTSYVAIKNKSYVFKEVEIELADVV